MQKASRGPARIGKQAACSFRRKCTELLGLELPCMASHIGVPILRNRGLLMMMCVSM